MGFFSYLCKECGHPLLSPQATDPGINDWMAQAAILTNRGSIIIGEYDGYGRAGEMEDGMEYAACLHEACWERAGRPGFKHYGEPSTHAPDQGFFFDDGDHDLIDPRIMKGREALLQAGIEVRTQARYDRRARDVYEWVYENGHDPKPDPTWRHRFGCGQAWEAGKVVEGQWFLTDRLGILPFEENFKGTEEEVKAHLSGLWDAFTASPEYHAFIARALEMREASRRAHHEQLKLQGRYEFSYNRSRTVLGETKFVVRDRMTYENAIEFDHEGPGDDPKARQARAMAEAARLNQEWADAGYPYVEPEPD